MKTNNTINKCQECGAIWFANKTKEHHKKNCSFNKEPELDWQLEEDKRNKNIYNFLMNEFTVIDNVQKMTNKELADYIINNIWSNQKCGSMEDHVLSEAIDRLNSIYNN